MPLGESKKFQQEIAIIFPQIHCFQIHFLMKWKLQNVEVAAVKSFHLNCVTLLEQVLRETK